MIKHKKVAGCENIKTAQQKNSQFCFTLFMTLVKVCCYQVSALLNKFGGVLQ
jgi:hypothetical protein